MQTIKEKKMKKNFSHTPILTKEVIKALKIKKNGIYIDSTFGCGGHTKKILKKIGKKGKVYAIDRDPKTIFYAKKIHDKRFNYIINNFSKIKKIAKKKKIYKKVNGILFDLGISSAQLDNPKRGFSFKNDGPLDMRMNQNDKIKASNWISQATKKEIATVLYKFGENRFAKKIAQKIFLQRKRKKIKSTKDLSNIINSIISYSKNKKNPSTKSFQAIRIHINKELKEIKIALNLALKILSQHGRIVILSFHSLEARIIKDFINQNTKEPLFLKKIPLKEQQINQMYKKKIKVISKIKPKKREIFKNIRSRSAILRVLEKL